MLSKFYLLVLYFKYNSSEENIVSIIIHVLRQARLCILLLCFKYISETKSRVSFSVCILSENTLLKGKSTTYQC